MPSKIFLILPVVLASHGITLLIVQSGYRKVETTVLWGFYFLFNALLAGVLIFAAPYKIIWLECLRGYGLFFTFFFLFMAWNSIVIPARKWWEFSKYVIILGIVVGTFHAVVTLCVPNQQGLIMDAHRNLFISGAWGISILLMIAASGYVVLRYTMRMIGVNRQFLKYIMNNYSYIEQSLIRYKNGIIVSCVFVLITFFTCVMMILYSNIPVLIVYTGYQLLYIYIVFYFIFNFTQFKKSESKVTVYYSKFLNDTNIQEYNMFFPEETEILLDDKHEELRRRLITYFEESRPYVFKKLIMNDVARDLNTNRTYISQIINTDFGTTFFNFVNVFRIEEAKRQIEADSPYSLKAIADNCGFSSYTTFVKYHKMYNSKSAAWYEKRQAASK